MSEIVIIMGYNAAGKTTCSKPFVEKGYHRINRDEIGGKLKNLHTYAEKALAKGIDRIVLDNTYADVESRKPIVDVAKAHGIPIRCIHLKTSFEDAQVNACQRMIRETGRLLMPENFAKTKNPNHFPPAAIFNYRKRFEAPTLSEGFSEIEEIKFVRSYCDEYKNAALILDFDDTLRSSTGALDYPVKPSEVSILPGRKEKIQEWKDANPNGIVAGVSNQSGIAKGKLSLQAAIDCFDHTCEGVGHEIDYYFCPHLIPPVKCYCRKPHPGIGVLLIEKYKLDPSKCLFVGDQTSDKTFAKRCGFNYLHPKDFF